MNFGFSEDVVTIKNPQILCGGQKLPDSLSVVSLLDSGGWVTQVSFGGSYQINGIVMQSIYEDGILSLGVNNRHINAVYRFTEKGETLINRVSNALTQKCDISLYICTFRPGKIYLHHDFLDKTLPVLGEVKLVESSYEIPFAGLCEQTEINCCSSTITQKTGISEQYKAVLDPVSGISTLLKQEKLGSRVLSVCNIHSGEQIYAQRAL